MFAVTDAFTTLVTTCDTETQVETQVSDTAGGRNKDLPIKQSGKCGA